MKVPEYLVYVHKTMVLTILKFKIKTIFLKEIHNGDGPKIIIQYQIQLERHSYASQKSVEYLNFYK